MSPRRHAMITGTGRAGTTFLVELLTHLGLDTGFSADSVGQKKDRLGRAGLEQDIRKDDSPYIVKNPWFCDYADKVLSRDDLLIEHIFVPIRDLYAAAQSRRHVSETGSSSRTFLARLKSKIKPKHFAGGLWHINSGDSGKQEDVLLKQLYKLMLAISNAEVPMTLIQYPKLTKDSSYLFDKLKPILKGIEFETFNASFNKVVRPDLVNSFSEADR